MVVRIVGGAARTGKGIISRRLLEETHAPYLSLDVIKMDLANGVPSLGIDPEASSTDFALKIWPFVRAMAVNMIETGVGYTIEGEILPEQVHELARSYPGAIKACFLGYKRITPTQKLKEIRQHSGHPNDWVEGYSDDYVLDLVRDEIEFSHYLARECERLGLAYFDTSDDFAVTLEQVVAYLRG
jgi:hypothetical protein